MFFHCGVAKSKSSIWAFFPLLIPCNMGDLAFSCTSAMQKKVTKTSTHSSAFQHFRQVETFSNEAHYAVVNFSEYETWQKPGNRSEWHAVVAAAEEEERSRSEGRRRSFSCIYGGEWLECSTALIKICMLHLQVFFYKKATACIFILSLSVFCSFIDLLWTRTPL